MLFAHKLTLINKFRKETKSKAFMDSLFGTINKLHFPHFLSPVLISIHASFKYSGTHCVISVEIAFDQSLFRIFHDEKTVIEIRYSYLKSAFSLEEGFHIVSAESSLADSHLNNCC